MAKKDLPPPKGDARKSAVMQGKVQADAKDDTLKDNYKKGRRSSFGDVREVNKDEDKAAKKVDVREGEDKKRRDSAGAFKDAAESVRAS